MHYLHGEAGQKGCLTLNMIALISFEASGIIYRSIRRNISEPLNRQEHH
jgi:hypothetical protein